MKSPGLSSGAAIALFCAASLSSCGTSDGEEPHDARGGSSASGRAGGASGRTAGGGQPNSGGTSGSLTGGAPSGGAGVAGSATSGGAGGHSTGGVSGALAGSGGLSGGAGRSGSSGGGSRGDWTCESFGAEICFCRLGGEPLAGASCTGSWNCCFVTGTAERGNCQCFDTASDAECTDTVAGVMGTRAQACPP